MASLKFDPPRMRIEKIKKRSFKYHFNLHKLLMCDFLTLYETQTK
jgi:hypothetical protein